MSGKNLVVGSFNKHKFKKYNDSHFFYVAEGGLLMSSHVSNLVFLQSLKENPVPVDEFYLYYWFYELKVNIKIHKGFARKIPLGKRQEKMNSACLYNDLMTATQFTSINMQIAWQKLTELRKSQIDCAAMFLKQNNAETTK